ncbi:unnamed protein product [Blepharisma stoltei]|uniref:Uncharacterized protein n=1 Tax=Blepharisma stoltei TaxID=1481888 RepID=A0AAU9K0R0_9CILI|nr:unnamed protein product [Blepharisma stoltei]
MDKYFPGYVKGISSAIALMKIDFSQKELTKISEQGPEVADFVKSLQICKRSQDEKEKAKCVAVNLAQGNCKKEFFLVGECIKNLQHPKFPEKDRTQYYCSNVDASLDDCLSSLTSKVLFALSDLPIEASPNIREID